MNKNFNIPYLIDFDWENKDQNKIIWSKGTIMFEGKKYNISSGISNRKYIYWIEGQLKFRTTNNIMTAMGLNSWVMAENNDGNLVKAGTTNIIHSC